MKRILFAGLAAALLSAGAPAQAADFPVKAAATQRNWTGWNLGVSGGGRWADVTGTTISWGGGTLPFPSQATQSYSSSTYRIGGYLGYDWQFAPKWLVGLEGDFAWGDGSKRLEFLQALAPVNAGSFSEFRHTWDAGVRARFGFLVTPSWLVYGTGGVQWQHVEATANCAALTCGVIVPGGTAFQQTNSTTRTGWTLGGGVETMFSNRWTARLEYRYADYGTWRTVFGPPAVAITKDFTVHTDTVLLGIGRKF